MTDLCFNANPSVNVSKNLISRALPTTLTSNPDWVVPRRSSLAIRTASGKVSPMVIGLHGLATGFVSFATHGSGKSYPIHRPVVSAKARYVPRRIGWVRRASLRATATRIACFASYQSNLLKFIMRIGWQRWQWREVADALPDSGANGLRCVRNWTRILGARWILFPP